MSEVSLSEVSLSEVAPVGDGVLGASGDLATAGSSASFGKQGFSSFLQLKEEDSSGDGGLALLQQAGGGGRGERGALDLDTSAQAGGAAGSSPAMVVGSREIKLDDVKNVKILVHKASEQSYVDSVVGAVHQASSGQLSSEQSGGSPAGGRFTTQQSEASALEEKTSSLSKGTPEGRVSADHSFPATPGAPQSPGGPPPPAVLHSSAPDERFLADVPGDIFASASMSAGVSPIHRSLGSGLFLLNLIGASMYVIYSKPLIVKYGALALTTGV